MKLYNYHAAPNTLIGYERRSKTFPYLKSRLNFGVRALDSRTAKKEIVPDYEYEAIVDDMQNLINLRSTVTTAQEAFNLANECRVAAVKISDIAKRTQHPLFSKLLRKSNILFDYTDPAHRDRLFWPNSSHGFKLIKRDPAVASRYITLIVKDYVPELESALLQLDQFDTIEYLCDRPGGYPMRMRSPQDLVDKMEDKIAQDPVSSLLYSVHYTGHLHNLTGDKCFPKGEYAIYHNTNKDWWLDAGFYNGSREDYPGTTAWECYLNELEPGDRQRAMSRAAKWGTVNDQA